MKNYPYIAADLVDSVRSVLSRRENVVEQELRIRHKLQDENLVSEDQEQSLEESPVVGVIKGQLPGDQHMCATRVFSEQFGQGVPVYSMHAEPDENGLIEWYDVLFEHGIERVFTADIDVLDEMSHDKHPKKMKKMKR